mmetsp:Transcript_114797/g.331753  ORF Transcript_114797/g.331753 Transcript_114797/m.331753 type:complete len:310 (+) Transcript_114797:1222-2151(+)
MVFQQLPRHTNHLLEQCLEAARGPMPRRQQVCSIAVALDLEAIHPDLLPREEIEQAPALARGAVRLEVELQGPGVAVHDRPSASAIGMTPTRGVDAVALDLGRVGQPLVVVRGEVRGAKPPPHRLESSESLAVPLGEGHVDAPHVLPTLVAHAVEMGELQRRVAVLRPSVADMGLTAALRIEPLGAVHAGLPPEGVRYPVAVPGVVVAPTQNVPIRRRPCVIPLAAPRRGVASPLGLPDDGISDGLPCLDKLFIHEVHRVAIEPVCACVLQQLRQGDPMCLPFGLLAQPLVERVVSPQYANPLVVKLFG